MSISWSEEFKLLFPSGPSSRNAQRISSLPSQPRAKVRQIVSLFGFLSRPETNDRSEILRPRNERLSISEGV